MTTTQARGSYLSSYENDGMTSRISTGRLPGPDKVSALVHKACEGCKGLDDGKVADLVAATSLAVMGAPLAGAEATR